MDFLSQDPDIAPELVVFLTEKLRKTKGSLELMEQENKRLQEELACLQRRPCSAGPRSENDFEIAFACQAGICPSVDDAKSLTKTVGTLREQLEVRSQEHHDNQAEIARLQACLDSTESKYDICKTQLKACLKELQGFKHSAGVENGAEAIEIDEMSLEVFDQPEITVDKQKLQQQEGGHGLEVDDVDPHSRWEKFAGTVCLPTNVDNPRKLSQDIQELSHDGILFELGCTMAKPSDQYAWLYMPLQKCTPGESLSWTDNSDLDEHRGKIRDLFYRGRQGICYAGSFEYGGTAEMSAPTFRHLARQLKDTLFESSFTIPAKDVPEDTWKLVYNMYWDGTAKLKRFRFKRTGFNQPLYDAMIAARGPTPIPTPSKGKAKDSGTQKKRKKNDHQGPPVPKRPKH